MKRRRKIKKRSQITLGKNMVEGMDDRGMAGLMLIKGRKRELTHYLTTILTLILITWHLLTHLRFNQAKVT